MKSSVIKLNTFEQYMTVVTEIKHITPVIY